ncbi:MAG: HEPN domain-containing protein [Chloroflexota bacterium]
MIVRIPEKAATRKAAPKKLSARLPRNGKPRLPKRAQLALAEFQQRALELFPDGILAIILYGSYARGEATPDSDVDVLVVTNWTDPKGEDDFYRPTSGDPRADSFTEIASRVSLKYGLDFAARAWGEREFNTDEPLAGEAKREGIVLWQKEGWKMADKEEEHPAKPRDPQTWIALADLKLDNAKQVFRIGLNNETISVAYYAMFYAARAALLSKGLYLVKHAAAEAKFSELFVATGKVDQKYSSYLGQAHQKREKSDYKPFEPTPREDAEKILADAEAFIAKVKELIAPAD